MAPEARQAPTQDPEECEIVRARVENGAGKSRFQKRIDKLMAQRSERDGRIAELEKQVDELTQGLRVADQLIGKYKLALKRRKHG